MDCFNGHYAAGLYDYEKAYINSMTEIQKNFLKERGKTNE
jgi:amidophosphoribosyltransferase